MRREQHGRRDGNDAVLPDLGDHVLAILALPLHVIPQLLVHIPVSTGPLPVVRAVLRPLVPR